MKIAVIDLYDIYCSFELDYREIYPFGLDIDTDIFYELVDEAFIDYNYRDVQVLTLYERLSTFVVTEVLVTFLNRYVLMIHEYLIRYIPPEFMIIPDRVEYIDALKYRMFWRTYEHAGNHIYGTD